MRFEYDLIKDMEIKSKEEERLEQLEQKYFLLRMQDHWDSSDYKYANELREEIKRCKDAINE